MPSSLIPFSRNCKSLLASGYSNRVLFIHIKLNQFLIGFKLLNTCIVYI